MKTQWTFWKKANSPGHGPRKSRDFIGSECVRMSCMDDRKCNTASSCLFECGCGYINPSARAGLISSTLHLHDLLITKFPAARMSRPLETKNRQSPSMILSRGYGEMWMV